MLDVQLELRCDMRDAHKIEKLKIALRQRDKSSPDYIPTLHERLGRK